MSVKLWKIRERVKGEEERSPLKRQMLYQLSYTPAEATALSHWKPCIGMGVLILLHPEESCEKMANGFRFSPTFQPVLSSNNLSA